MFIVNKSTIPFEKEILNRKTFFYWEKRNYILYDN